MAGAPAGSQSGAHAKRRSTPARRAPSRLAPGTRGFTATLVAIALIVGGGAVYLVMRGTTGAAQPSADACPGPSIQVAAAPEIAPVVAGLAEAAGCDQVSVTATADAVASQQVGTGKDAPDVWIPTSSMWTARAATAAPATPQVLVDSVATSPVVLVAAGTEPPTAWAAALDDPDLLMGDPLTSAAAAVPLLAGSSEGSAADLAGVVVPLAQARAGAADPAPGDAQRLATLEADSSGVTAASEQQYLANASDLNAGVPDAGTVFLDFPAVLTSTADRRADIEPTTTALAGVLASKAARNALAAAGFRGPDGAPLEDGVGKVRAVTPGAEQVTQALQQWATLALPTRSLAVIDVSGSMDFDAGGQTRMQLTTAATAQGLSLFPDAAAIGLWAFSEQLDGDVDHRDLVTIRPLGSEVDGATQREALGQALSTLPALTGGGTGLYDTTLAAYRTVLDGWDPHAANSVLLFTDGANDDPGSISLAQLVDQLRQVADPARPVRIIAIGISADADASALKTIARATGGDAYIAEDPADMATVFGEALGSRTS